MRVEVQERALVLVPAQPKAREQEQARVQVVVVAQVKAE
jgi:hypothetical protein